MSAGALSAAQPRLHRPRAPGERLRLLRDVANLEHTQTDDFRWPCEPDESGPDFFLYDLLVAHLLRWSPWMRRLSPRRPVSRSATSQPADSDGGAVCAARAVAIAVKAQHAYTRTLAWGERSDAEAQSCCNASSRSGTTSTRMRGSALAIGAGRAVSSSRSSTPPVQNPYRLLRRHGTNASGSHPRRPPLGDAHPVSEGTLRPDAHRLPLQR